MAIKHFTPSQDNPCQLGIGYFLITNTAISDAAAHTFTPAELQSGQISRDCNGSARSDVLPSAALLVAAVPDPQPGRTFECDIRNVSGTAVSITLTAGTGCTIVGTATIAQNNLKTIRITITNRTAGSEAYTVYSKGSSTF